MIDPLRVFEELSTTPTKADLDGLEARIGEHFAALAEASARADGRFALLEERMAELAEAHRETERRLQRIEEKFARMIDEFADLRRQVGGLSDAVGYGLENSVFPYLRSFAMQEFEIGPHHFDRRNLEYPDGRFDEINIYGEGRREGDEVILIGEAKSQPSKRDVDALAGRVDRSRTSCPQYSAQAISALADRRRSGLC